MNKIKLYIYCVTILSIGALICGCERTSSDSVTAIGNSGDTARSTDNFGTDAFSSSVHDDKESEFAGAKSKAEAFDTLTTITFNETTAEIDGEGAVQSGSALIINKEGTYKLSGTFKGQIIVEVTKTELVYLDMCGVEITESPNSAIWVKSADKTVIILEKDTVNNITDNNLYTGINSDGEPNACLFSKDDLTIKGDGELNINALYGNGIMSKDDLKINGGTINIKAAKNGLVGNDSVTVSGGIIDIEAEKDGIKTSNTEDADKGFILVEVGSISIKCGDDALQATKAVTVNGGKLHMESKGKDINCDGEVNVNEDCII